MELTPEKPVRILLVDDDEDDYVLTRDLLTEIPDARFELDWAGDERAALRDMAAGAHDLYLVDYRLGGSTGLDLIREAHRRGCRRPMIVLTGLGERAIDFEAMKAGAADYLEKDKLDAALLERSVRYSLLEARHAEELERRVGERTEALAALNEALRETDRRKNEFLATLAHELRNPLVPIRNALELMRLAPDDSQVAARGRGMIERQVHQLVRLIDDLLDISRITRGKIQLRKEPVSLRTVVDSAMESSRPLIDNHGHTLSVRLPEPMPVIDCDATRIAQVLLNLLNNAAKYTEPGGRIDLEGWRDGDHIVLVVRDSGVGISREALPHIFEMFNQSPRVQDYSHGGLGIGLWLVRNLIELHGGTIEAHSDGPGKGSRFEVRLPCGSAEKVAAP